MPRGLFLTLSPLLAAAILLALLATPASAAPTKIAGWGVGAGKVDNPQGVAVDQSSGDLYVADRNNRRIDRFDSEGKFLLAWGAGVADGEGPGLQVCGPEAPEPTKRCFEGLGSGSTSGSEEAVRAVDVAVEAASGDLYVTELGGDRASRFTPEGEFVFTLGKDVNKTKLAEGAPQAERDICTAASGDACGRGKDGAGPGEFENPNSLAFDGEGRLWVNDGKRLQRFDSGGGFIEEFTLPTGTRSGALAIDPTTDDFYVLGPQGHNEWQRVSRTESGKYTLSFEGEPTEGLVGSKAADGSGEIQKALEALPAIGEGNVSVEEFGPFGYSVTFIRGLGGRDVPQLTASGGSPPVTVATQTEGNAGSVRRLDSTGAAKGELDDEPGDRPEALATDAAGNLYLGDVAVPYRLERYDPAGSLTSVFAAGQVIGGPTGNAIAIDEGSAERPPALYTASSSSNEDESAVQRFDLPEPGPLPENQRAEDILPTAATLAAELNPEGNQTTYRFEYGTSESYGQSTAEETLGAEGFEAEGVEAQLDGLTPDTTYHFRLVAADQGNPACPGEQCTVQGPDTTFTTLTAVGIEAQWASGLSAHEATLNALLDPLGAEAEWWLEYGTSLCSQGGCAKALEGHLSAESEEAPVAVALSGLESSTTYHYRFVATDEREVKEGGEAVIKPFTTYGPDRSFATQPAGLALSLPDNRAWEMVSPPDKHGGQVAHFDGSGGGHVQAAADGEALAYLSYGSLEANPEGNRIIEQSSELARRAPGGAWSSTDITPPHTTATSIQAGSSLEYKLFSTNLERSLLEPRDCTSHSPQASERTPYVRQNSEPPAYIPLVTAAEVAPGTEFGGDCTALFGPVKVRGASPDLGHVVLASSVPLAAGAAPDSLYASSAVGLEPLSVLPAGEGGGAVKAELGAGERSVHGAVSTDGSRVFFSSGKGLYVRDTLREESARLDAVQGGFGTGGNGPAYQGPIFQAASADGSAAFFTDTRNLTEDANEEGADLYRWKAPGTHGCGQPGGCLEDLSSGVANFGESAEVEGHLAGYAKDGSAAFFIARGVLDTEVANHGAGPDEAQPGQPNLYAWREGEGVRFIARLAEADRNDWNVPRLHTAQASPSGRYLAFMSERPLTGYDNRALGSGERAQEVFRYDAQGEALACMSCEPSGARPRAWLEGAERSAGEEALDPEQLWGDAGIGWQSTVAALVPEAGWISAAGSLLSLYTPRYVHDDGRVYFNAAGPLVSADSNDAADVYQYEPTGVGSCSASAADAGTATIPGGCVSLISSGTAGGPAAFLDASEGASDVFFYSPARLSVTDVDSELDVYDARVGGEPATLSPVAECLGEACQPPATPPEALTPASAAFRGPGNVREKSAGASRCAKPARRAQRLSRRARGLRRAAKRSEKARNSRRMGRKARRLARRARRTSNRAKRCRARARARANRRSRR